MDDNALAPNAKVAIPRLGRSSHQAPSPKPKLRRRGDNVNKACLECRKRKIKCSGTVPQCKNCNRNSLECLYEQKRRDRLKEALHRNNTLTRLLEDISSRIGDEERAHITATLENLDNEVPPISPPRSLDNRRKTKTTSSSSRNQDDDDGNSGPARSVSSDDSDADLDMIEEFSHTQEPDGPGYLGRNSVIKWLQSLQEEIVQPGVEPFKPRHGFSGFGADTEDCQSDTHQERQLRTASGGSIMDYYFYLDSDDMTNASTDCHIMPSAETANRLFAIYEEAVQMPFPILCNTFKEELHAYYDNTTTGNNLDVCERWKAVLNLVCAIGARYDYLTRADLTDDDNEHVVYMRRAMGLLGYLAPVSVPDLALIRATGLLSFYFLATGYVNKAWHIIGISIRYAQAAGLHLKNRDASFSPNQRKMARQAWWGLHSIESVLTAITGRPCVITDRNYNVAPPRTPSPMPSTDHSTPNQDITQPSAFLESASRGRLGGEAQLSGLSRHGITIQGPKSDRFLGAYVGIDLILRKTLASLYSASDAQISWSRMQRKTASLISALQEWSQRSLSYQIILTMPNIVPDLDREQLLLNFYYCSVMISITRPFLCRVEHRPKEQSENSAKFNRNTARLCVQAALHFTLLLPDSPSSCWFYEQGPWWSSVHNVMQAMTVLLIELSVEATSLVRTSKLDLVNAVQKLFEWLQTLAIKDVAGRRAYAIICAVFKQYGELGRFDVPGNPEDDPIQQNEPGPSTTNITREPFSDVRQAQPTAYHSPTTQAAPDLWPHTWPDDNHTNIRHYDRYYPGHFPATTGDETHLDYNQENLQHVYGPNEFMAHFNDNDGMEWDISGFNYQTH